MPNSSLALKALVFAAAFMSFACLFVAFYGVFTMQAFGIWVLLPSIGILLLLVAKNRNQPLSQENPARWIVHGCLGGLAGAVVYDLYRLPFVLTGAPLFRPFPKFGELLLGSTEPRWAVHSIGWLYHFSNGAALGIMFMILWSFFPRVRPLFGAVVWAMIVEIGLLISPYTAFFGLQLNAKFLALTVSAHIVFGLGLGWYCARRAVLRPAA